MLETIWSWIMENYPGIFAMLVVAYAVWHIRGWYSKFDARVKACEAHEPAIEEIKNDVKTLQKDIDSVKMDVKSIKDYLVTKDQKAINVLAMKNSPMVLNENGKQIYEIIVGDKFLADNKTLLFERIDSKKPRTPLDVEIAAKEVLIDLLSSPIFDGIKNIVYNYPSIQIKQEGKDIDYAISISDVCFVLSIPLRDMYLEAHPEINTKDNDNK
ncbi:hypothetical protein [uncultured Parabacteroides sp.]|jgi:hypothetical protein|uniref:hypothetical protein n=1 Tax=uncultured Parabacteroides sp. TaxID=512312 RepID=UPI0020678EF7|nr:hypothetical protein [uncultured Parabacteroides sp.]DAW28935.1 MAG TPA: holin family protein [Caudoviricetes sp.]